MKEAKVTLSTERFPVAVAEAARRERAIALLNIMNIDNC
jgi:hypothetical protein